MGWDGRERRCGRYVDGGNNSFVALRILNATHDLLFAEFAELQDWGFGAPYFVELYDQRLDPYQQHNIIDSASPALKSELHSRLRRAFECSGASCDLQ
jgi:hypothetical protein